MDDYYHPSDPYDDDIVYGGQSDEQDDEEDVYYISQNKDELDGDEALEAPSPPVDFNDPDIAALPRILLMGPRRGGKSSIQVCGRS